MARLILIFAVIAAFAVAVAAVTAATREVTSAISNLKEDSMPSAFRNIAFALLLMVMFGVATGWLGAL